MPLFGAIRTAAVCLTLASCADLLDVRNLNAPDIARTFYAPADIEAFAGTLYRSFHNGTQGLGGVQLEASGFALERYSAAANFNISLRAQIPRIPIRNMVTDEQFLHFSALSRLARSSANIVRAVDAMRARGDSIGTGARDQRARGFAMFVNGIALGHLALAYDSVAVATHLVPHTVIAPLIGADSAMRVALSQLDSAEIIFAALQPSGLVFPAVWVNNVADHSVDEMQRLLRSYRARLRASSARTPTEREDVEWARVLADAENGIASDHVLRLQNPGWTSTWDFQSQNVPLMYIGFADTSGAFQAEWAKPLFQRRGIDVVVRTADRRWPRGNTDSEQRANSGVPLSPGQYLANDGPPASLDAGNLWAQSQYHFFRFRHVRLAGANGIYVFMPRAEIRLLAAEAHYRLGNRTAAAALVNESRVAAGLPPILDPDAPVPGTDGTPGGNACVPRLPNAACGSLWEALKYEKRMETMFLGFMSWYLDMRGWGDLVYGTAVHWPVPIREMDARGLSFYDMPSAGTSPASGLSTYGYGNP